MEKESFLLVKDALLLQDRKSAHEPHSWTAMGVEAIVVLSKLLQPFEPDFSTCKTFDNEKRQQVVAN